jgi:hypothetical protein
MELNHGEGAQSFQRSQKPNFSSFFGSNNNNNNGNNADDNHSLDFLESSSLNRNKHQRGEDDDISLRSTSDQSFDAQDHLPTYLFGSSNMTGQNASVPTQPVALRTAMK